MSFKDLSREKWWELEQLQMDANFIFVDALALADQCHALFEKVFQEFPRSEDQTCLVDIIKELERASLHLLDQSTESMDAILEAVNNQNS